MHGARWPVPKRLYDGEAVTTSQRVNLLSDGAEVFYVRLIGKADDYGRYDARPEILRANLYPLRIKKVTEKRIAGWLKECVEVGLLWTYEVNGGAYVEVLRWFNHQRQRHTKARFPAPAAFGGELPQAAADGGELRPEVEVEVEVEVTATAPLRGADLSTIGLPDTQVYLLERLRELDPGWDALDPKTLRRMNLDHSQPVVTTALGFLREAPGSEPVRSPVALLEAMCQTVEAGG
jgi:hypothetical protein